jgi:ESS family glutamate:Na+ symporter
MGGINMASNYNLWDYSVWEFVIAITILLTGMIVANAMIRLVKPLRNLLIPGSVLGGFILFFAFSAYKAATGEALVQASTLELLTYHGLGLGCTAVALKTEKHSGRKHAQRDIFNSSLVTTSSYIVQALCGLAVSFALSFVLLDVWPASGMLVPMGFGQGPGQAYNWGHTYEMSWGFTNGTSYGLSVASIGFVACSIGGVIYLNLMRVKGNLKAVCRVGDDVEDDLCPEDVSGPNELPLSDSLDKLTVEMALVFITYFIAFGLTYILSTLCDRSGVGLLITTVKPLLWGFNFIFAALAGVITKAFLNFFGKRNIIEKEYVNNMFMDRISGLFFDIMIVASIAAINLSAFKEQSFVIPLVISCLLATLATYFYVDHVTKLLFPTYSEESFLSLYGMLTGVVGTGIILLRQIDPKLETPASTNLVFQTLWACLTGFPLLLLMGFAPRSTSWIMASLAIFAVMFFVFYAWIRLAARKVARDGE